MKSILTLSISLLIITQSFGQAILAQAKSGDKWGYINKKGEFVIKPQYEKCNRFTEDGLVAIYEKKRKSFYFIKPNGEELQTEVEKFKLASAFGFGTKGFFEGIVAVQAGKKWGYMNTDGKLIVPAKFDKAREYNSGFAVAKSGSNFFIIDKKGTETKVDISGLQDVRRFSEGMAPYKANDVWGFINSSGKVVVKAEYKAVGYMNGGLAWAKNQAGLVGFINADGKMKIEPKFEGAKDFTCGLAKVKSGGWSFIDANGNMVTPPAADSYGRYSDDLVYAKKDGKVGFVDKKGSWVVKPTFEKVRDFNNGLAAVKEGEKWGFVDKSGEWVIKPQFDAVKDFHAAGK
ncbi:MAG: WG repeat-containing protein [Flavobacteriales bacterium]